MKRKINIVQNTHWDYEWYFTNDQSTVLFEFFMKELLEALETEKIDYFILDGQMGIVEKYLESFPKDKERIKSLNEKGKLSIGPWFTQTDQMIISSESIVRNLLTGHKIASDMGGAWKMAYVPDAFGQSINMPKIYNQFGIDKMIFWRGLSDSKCKNREIVWKSDSSSVKAVNIHEGYYSGGAIYWASEEELEKILTSISQNSDLENESILSLGGDQRYVDLDIRDKLNELNKQDKYEYGLSNYESYFEKLSNDLPIVEGEMLDSQDSKIHRSIYSHRYDHKYLNDKIERYLTNVVEPLMVIAKHSGIRSHLNIVDNAWRLLLLNSAHDSAGGCNSDITNEHILNRFKRAEELTTSLVDIVIRKISETAYEEGDIVLFNTLTNEKELWRDINLISKNEGFNLFDANGDEIEYDTLAKEKVYYGSINRDENDNDPELYYFKTKINFKHKVQPLSFTHISVKEDSLDSSLSVGTNNFIENENLRIEFVDSSLNLTNKTTGETKNNFIKLVADADDGDTYDYSPLPGSRRKEVIIESKNVKSYELINSKELEIEGEIKLPSSLDSWITGNLKEVSQRINIRISIEEEFIRLKLNTKNKTKDIRLRLVLDSNIDFDKVYSDVHYGFIERDIVQPEINNWKELGWKEEPTGIYPVLSNLYVKDEKDQLSVMLNGIKEYEAFENGIIELTLYRTIGWLGKPDLERRPGKASGQEFKYIETPDSQLLDVNLEWELGFVFGYKSNSNIVNMHKTKMNENVYYQNQEYDRFTGPLKYFVSNKWKHSIERGCKVFEQIDIKDGIEITILKQLENGDLLIRMVNHTNDKISEPIFVNSSDISKAFESNLLEEYKEEIMFDSNVGLKFPSIDKKEIKTIIINTRR